MQILYVLVALLPALALAGPPLIGWYFDADWILKAGVGFDAVAVALGLAVFWLLGTTAPEQTAAPPAGASLARFLGGGLAGWGLLFGTATVWLIFSPDRRATRHED